VPADETNARSVTGSGADGRIRVALVFGGRSSEHPISCATAAGVLRAIDRTRYEVVPLGISPDGEWVLAADDPDRWSLRPGHTPQVEGPEQGGDGHVVLPLSASGGEIVVLRSGGRAESFGRVDVVFPVLHGPFGEDGTLQGLLELAGVPYVGSGVLASSAGMDKHYMKVVLAGHGLPIGPYTVITSRRWRSEPDVCLRTVGALGSPVFVKPARAGSSFGITKVSDAGDAAAVRAAIEAAHEHDPKVVVEAGIVGREIECGVLEGRGDAPPRTTLPGEIVVDPGHGFYHFDAKYLSSEGVRLACPADLPDEAQARMRELAARTFDAFGAEGLSRVDCFYTPDGDFIVNEINTLPGFTPSSMYPFMWQQTGLAYPDLIDELIQLALERPVGLR
jgi:D-alanine-D-alanine ligase